MIGEGRGFLFLPPAPSPRRLRVATTKPTSWLEAQDSIEEALERVERVERAGEGRDEEEGG